ncbi:uncharacterized protein VTP21DRAFT_8725 [Calcarisporiella thermophila]|uniref:uncharacterized protein n=1 Tax=Calcarisporiella thermophila TaxID=911321 RepID=UPI0037449736
MSTLLKIKRLLTKSGQPNDFKLNSVRSIQSSDIDDVEKTRSTSPPNEDASHRVDIPRAESRKEDSAVSENHRERNHGETEGENPPVRERLDDAKIRFLHPAGVKRKHRTALAIIGRIGFVAKGLVYAIIGGLTCATAVRYSMAPEELEVYDESPQGAFIFVGGLPIGVALLCVMFLGVLMYAIWRFWEAFTGQGADAKFSRKKIFFRTRLAPFVSGLVYTAYLIFLGKLIINAKQFQEKSKEEKTQIASQGCFPTCWRESAIGIVGLLLFGTAFGIATLTQIINAVTKQWHRDLDMSRVPRWVALMVFAAGHIGFAGRAGVFLFTCILMFKAISTPVDTSHSTFANALNQSFQIGIGGQIVLFIVGFFVVIYGAFAVSNAYFKIFPTPPPSRLPERVRTETANEFGVDPEDPHGPKVVESPNAQNSSQMQERTPG